VDLASRPSFPQCRSSLAARSSPASLGENAPDRVRSGSGLSRELPAQLGEGALLALVQGIEGSLYALGVRREEALDE
jgi:hypothetical protein